MLTYYRETISTLLRKLQLLRARPLTGQELCLEIQEILILKLSYFERRIRLLKGQIKSYNQLLKTKKSTPLTKAEANAVKLRKEDNQYLIDEYQNLQFLFRSIGDALAFIYIDSWDIKPLAFKEAPGALSGKKGARLERRILRRIVKSGYIAILNDVTNSLRYGDISVVQDGFPQILEVKSGKAKTARDNRQKENIEKIQEYLYTDEVKGLYGNDLGIRRTAAHSKAKYNRDKLNKVIEDALSKGRSWLRAESGVYYYVELTFSSTGIDEVIARCSLPPMTFYLNSMKYSNTSYFPFALSIENPDALLKFYMGDLLILVFIDPAVIIKKFMSKGLAVSFDYAGEYALTLTPMHEAEDKPAFMRIGKHMFWRVPFEFLSLNWLLDEFIHRYLNHAKSDDA